MIAISYRRDDSLPIAGRLYDRLQATFGKPNIFMDFDSIRPGLDFRAQISDTIGRSEVVIALIGPHWAGRETDGSRRIDDANDFVRIEIAQALKRNIPIIPVLINNTPMPKAETLPEDMRDLVYRHALPLDTGLDFHQHADRVIAGVSGLVRTSQPNDDKPGASSSAARTSSRRVLVVVAAALVLLAAIGWLLFSGAFTRKNDVISRTTVSDLAIPSTPSPPASLEKKPTLEISSEPAGAKVLTNGLLIGTTPLRRDDFEAGVRQFVLMADGHLPRVLDAKIDPTHGFVSKVTLASPAPLYVGAVRVRDGREPVSSRPLTIKLGSDLATGTMTQGSKRGDFVVRFTGVWEGTELHAVTGEVVTHPPGLQWTPESFILRFSDDGRQATYECVASGKTYFADLAAQSQFLARLASVYQGTVGSTKIPIKIAIAADRKSGVLTETSKSGDTVVAFTGVWDDRTFRAVTGDVISKPEKVQWKPESFALQFSEDGRHVSYSCNDAGQTLTADLSPAQ